VDLLLTPHHFAKAFRTDHNAKILKIVAKSQKEVFGIDPEYTLCGASVPIVTRLAEISGGQVAMFGTSLSTDDFHAPNEHFEIERLRQGFLTMGQILFHLAQ
jgi:acetylornithine deacetylase/succinyl-diaminopimelate desuccinylase-like protein